MKTKAVTISLLLFSFMCLTSCNNTGGKLEELEKQVNKIALNTANADPIYRLYPTRNMWNFLKLDTRNGKISMVQFSVEDNEKQFEYELSNKALCENTAPGRFMLQPTENIYNFIMLERVLNFKAKESVAHGITKYNALFTKSMESSFCCFTTINTVIQKIWDFPLGQ